MLSFPQPFWNGHQALGLELVVEQVQLSAEFAGIEVLVVMVVLDHVLEGTLLCAERAVLGRHSLTPKLVVFFHVPNQLLPLDIAQV